ncbi:MAG: phosphatase PAP2 family protein [Elusimicrobiaceae bacterium]|nr:phosphatase PAP2 family protein [Elusimicrobiaceae bacterium]
MKKQLSVFILLLAWLAAADCRAQTLPAAAPDRLSVAAAAQTLPVADKLSIAAAPRIKWTENENATFSPAYIKRFWRDLVELPGKPLHWNGNEWAMAGGVIGGSLLAFTIDDTVRQNLKTHRSGFFTSLSDVTTHWGDWKQQVPILMGVYVTGLATKNETLNKIAADGVEASVIAAGILNPLAAYVAGRALPNADENAMKFEPFTPGRYSFPSGHTTAAFALSTVLDQNLRAKFGYWQTPLLYGMAAGCAVSRVYDHTHYVSEIIWGAGVGWAVGYWVSNKPRNISDRTVFLIPVENGAKLACRF